MKCGIEAVDNHISPFPEKGLVVICGTTDIYQAHVVLEMAKSLSQSFDSGIVITDAFARWTTREIAENHSTLGILENETHEMPENFGMIYEADNRTDYGLIVVDAMKARGTLADLAMTRKVIRAKEHHLVLVNCNGCPDDSNVDIEGHLLLSADITLKITEDPDNKGVNIAIFCPHIEQKGQKYNSPKDNPGQSVNTTTY